MLFAADELLATYDILLPLTFSIHGLAPLHYSLLALPPPISEVVTMRLLMLLASC